MKVEAKYKVKADAVRAYARLHAETNAPTIIIVIGLDSHPPYAYTRPNEWMERMKVTWA